MSQSLTLAASARVDGVIEYTLTNKQARQFILLHQGLLGSRRFAGKAGVYEYICQNGCVQFDPVDVCGRNADIVLHARVKGYRKQMLQDLLYKGRRLVDHWDKNMSIYPTKDWPYFGRARQHYAEWNFGQQEVEEVAPAVMEKVERLGVACAKDIGMPERVQWPWGSSPLGTAALEMLYYRGTIVIHHKQGTVRHYALAKEHMPAKVLAAADPHPNDGEYYAWHTLRRIGAVGLLWNRPSDAFLAIPGYKAEHRRAAFETLRKQGRIVPCKVQGIEDVLYLRAEEWPLLQQVLKGGVSVTPRLLFVAPLDSLMWDRKLVEALFGFSYKWEIYTPAAKRQYGHYVLPVLHGAVFAGRIEMRAERRGKQAVLRMCRYWPEAGAKQSGAFAGKLQKAAKEFAKFNDCDEVVYEENFMK